MTTTTNTITIYKSRWAAFFLTLLFGPLGLFYTTIAGGIIFTILTLLLFPLTFGLIIWVMWPFSIILGVLTAGKKTMKVEISS